MHLHHKIGQLFVVAARGTYSDDGGWAELVRHVRDNRVGGVIWFLSNAREAARVNARLQEIAATPLLVSADLEAGMGMRFTDATFWPPAMAVAAAGDLVLAGEQGRITAREAVAAGVNHILAPVVDVNVNPANPVINVRSFGADAEEVSRYGAALVRGIQSEGALATAKHFPGHGDTHVDSHRALPVLDATRERLDRVELVPFRAAIEAGVGCVMIGHLAVPSVDSTPAPRRSEFENPYGTALEEVPRDATMPASLSPAVIEGLLRRDLGFRGLVVSDAFDMGGLAAHFDPGQAAVHAIAAGIDQVMMSTDTDAAIAAVAEAVRSGRLPEPRVDAAVERVMEAKRRVVPPVPFDASRLDALVDAPEHRAVAEEIARRSIALVRDERGLLPLRVRNITAVVVTDLPEPNPLPVAVRELRPGRLLSVDSTTGGEALSAVDAEGVLVLLLALRPISGAGRIAVPPLVKRIVAEHGRRTVAISFGSPYVERDLPEAGAFVCAWGIQPLLQRAAVEAVRSARFPGRWRG